MTLTAQLLNQEELLNFAAEVKKQYDCPLERSTTDINREISEHKKKQATDIYLKYFPDFKGESPFFRDENKLFGYENDDCVIQRERQFCTFGVAERRTR